MRITCESSIAKRREILVIEKNKFHCILLAEKRISYLHFERGEQEESLRFIQWRNVFLFLHLWWKKDLLNPQMYTFYPQIYVLVVIRDSERKYFFAKKFSENENLFRSNITHRDSCGCHCKILAFDSLRFLQNAFVLKTRSRNVGIFSNVILFIVMVRINTRLHVRWILREVAKCYDRIFIFFYLVPWSFCQNRENCNWIYVIRKNLFLCFII